MMVLVLRPHYWRAHAFCFALVATMSEGAAGDGAEPTQEVVFPGEDVNLRSVPELKTLVSGDFLQPSARDLLESLKAQSGLPLVLDASVISDRPIQGATRLSKIPLWGAMEQLARNKYILGKWRLVGAEYRLFATYSGPPPPVPPTVPPFVENAIRKNVPLASSAPVPEPVQHRGSPILGLTAVGLLLIVLLALSAKYLRWIKISASNHSAGSGPSS